MAIKEINEKTTKRGGIREGAGRKKSLPEGAKPSSFILTDAEKTAGSTTLFAKPAAGRGTNAG